MRCLIISGGEYSKIKLTDKYDLVIACDKGYLHAKKLKIVPDIIVGDFDSSKEPVSCHKGGNCESAIIKVDTEKDDTDTGLAIKYALRNGYKDIDIVCALGKRLDHTLANISMLKYICENGAKGRIISNDIELIVIGKGKIKLTKRSNSYLSIFSLSDKSKINYIKGTKYDTKNIILKNSFPLGISNEFKGKVAEVSVEKGIILISIIKK